MTDHIQRYMSMTDTDFLYHAKFYRRFKGMSKVDHMSNIEYINDRCKQLGYILVAGCCNNYNVVKNDIQI